GTDAVDQVDGALPVDRVVDRLPYTQIVEGRFRQIQKIRVDVRIGAGDDLKSASLKLLNRIGWRRLRPIHVARLQRSQSRGRLGHWPQDESVQLWFAAVEAIEGGQLHDLTVHILGDP